MNYLFLIILTVIYCFAICYAIQIKTSEKNDVKSRIKLVFPKGKLNILTFSVALVALVVFAIFIEYIYDNTLLDNIKFVSIIAILCSAAYTDWDDHIIPNKLILEALILRIVLFLIELIIDINTTLIKGTNELIAACVILVLGFVGSLILKGSIGMGDVKLIAIMALFLGASGMVCSLVISLIVAFIYCIIMLISHKKHKKDIIPFAPSLLVGTYISICLFSF